MPERDGSLLGKLRATIGRESTDESSEKPEWPGVEASDRFEAFDGTAGASGPVTHVEIGGLREDEFRVSLGATPDSDGVNISLSAENRSNDSDSATVEIGSLGTFLPERAREIAATIEDCADYHDEVMSDV